MLGADYGSENFVFSVLRDAILKGSVTLQTTAGEEYTAEVDAPVGAPGRPLEETDRAVRQKFLRSADGILPDPKEALDVALGIDRETEVTRLVSLMTAH